MLPLLCCVHIPYVYIFLNTWPAQIVGHVSEIATKSSAVAPNSNLGICLLGRGDWKSSVVIHESTLRVPPLVGLSRDRGSLSLQVQVLFENATSLEVIDM